jgi:DNA-binding response OmpR family regulator
MDESLDRLRRNARVVVIEDDDALEDLVMAWLASRGMETVPIRGGAGPHRDGTARASSSLSPVRGARVGHLVNLSTNHDGQFEPRLRDASSPTVVLVVGPDVDANDIRTSMSAADTSWEDAGASVREWVEALLLKTHPTAPDHIKSGPLEIDAARRSVSVLSSDIRLTPTEFRLLSYLAENEGRVVGHVELLSTVWNPGYADDIHLLQETIRSLRGRISIVTDRQLIESVYGTGYRLAAWALESPAQNGTEDHGNDDPPIWPPVTASVGARTKNT